MKMEQLNNGDQPQKKKFQIKIAGFTFGVKHFAVLGVVILIIIIAQISKNAKLNKEYEEEQARLAEEEAAYNQANSSDLADTDLHSSIQKELSEQYGKAPDGFEWDYTGELVALGNDSDSSCEDVVYTFIRALSILDFSTAERYSSSSKIITDYKNYYSAVSNSITDYYSNFLRKQFKKSITSIEIDSISDTAVFSDGTQYVTLNLEVLDLTDKDFWVKDKDSLFDNMRTYKETETDDTKMKQYVYDYIYSKYEDGTIKKHPITIELVVTKQNGGGWLVSGDGELDSNLRYEEGVNVATYITENFNTWYDSTTLQEQLDKIDAELNSETN